MSHQYSEEIPYVYDLDPTAEPELVAGQIDISHTADTVSWTVRDTKREVVRQYIMCKREFRALLKAASLLR